MTVSGSDLKIGDAQAASWKDETSQSCKVEITFTPTGGSSKTITSGEKIAEAGNLTVKVTDDAGNSSSKEISWTWSKTLSLKQGGPATPTFEVRYLDTKARAIPDLQITIKR